MKTAASACKGGKTEHHAVLTDIQNGQLYVLDLDAEDPTAEEAVLWHWKPDPALGWQCGVDRHRRALSGVVRRWSEYYQTDVVLLTSAFEWVGIAEYPSGKCLWEQRVEGCPHAMEILPNGDVVVAASGAYNWYKGSIMYFNLSAGENSTMTDKVLFPDVHGVLYDPRENVIWTVGRYMLAAYEVVQSERGPKLSLVPDKGGRLPTDEGHNLSPDYHDPDYIWVSTQFGVYKFCKSRNEILEEYPLSEYMKDLKKTKGIASFRDGTVAYVSYGDGDTNYVFQDKFSVLWPTEDGGTERKTYTITSGPLWNKIRNFTTKLL